MNTPSCSLISLPSIITIMDPKQLFLFVMNSSEKPLPSVSLQYNEEHQTWYVNDPRMKTHRRYPLEQDDTYKKIRACVERRNANPNMLFYCRCTYCQPYMLSKAWGFMFGTTTPDAIATGTTTATPTPIPQVPVFPVLDFGKYRGSTFESVWKSDKPYCIWCLKKSATSDTMTANFTQFVGYIEHAIGSM